MNKWVYQIEDIGLENEQCLLNETVFHNANGYIGVRSDFEEGYAQGYDTIRGSYINGFYDIAKMSQAEKLCGLAEEKQTMLNVADTQTIFLKIEGETFCMFEGTVEKSSRSLDMQKGFTQRQVVWRSPGGHRVEITIRRMTSFLLLPLFTISYEVKALNFSGTLEFISVHNGDVKNYCNPNDPRVAGESFQHLRPVSAEVKDGVSYLVTETVTSGLTVCTAVKDVLSCGTGAVCRENSVQEGHSVTRKMETDIREGETVRLVKYTVFTDSLRYKDCRKEAENAMNRALSVSLEKWYRQQREYLDEFWAQSALDIEGDDDLAVAVRYNLYQLLQSAGRDEHSNIAAKGLSGEGYEGHYFWDTEMYMQPFFTLTNPRISASLIAYRYSILDAARENARIMGHRKGALYPWRTISGSECSGFFPAGSAQYHINGDIAYAVVAYYLATGDLDLMAEKGAEIIFETARLWMDAGNFHRGKFHINDVTGPDEYTCLVNNNYYTNAGAQYNLHWAVRFYELLGEAGKLAPVAEKIGLKPEEIREFKKAEEQMYLPYDEETGINPQDDSFLQKEVWDIKGTPADKFPLLLHYHPLCLYRYQVCKQADTVLAHFIYEDAQDLETIRKSFAYYENVTTHDSSLSTCIFSIVASRLGLKDKAYDYFGDSAKLDLFNLHHNTKDGIHTANMGGNYMAVVYGFGGLRLKETGICFAPVLPDKWESYTFKISYRGSHIQVCVGRDKSVFTLEKGEPREITVFGTKYLLKDTIEIER